MSDTKEYLSEVVGDKPLCVARSAKNAMHVRVFVASGNSVLEVTRAIATVCKSRTTRDENYIVYRGGGYSPAQQVAEDYAVAMGEDNHPYEDLH